MGQAVDVETFVARSGDLPLLDVRTPSEYADGHVPLAVNVPLFSDEERAAVGTAYHRESRAAAMQRGLEAAGPKLPLLVKCAREIVPDGEALVYCWRGGMRSEAFDWLLTFAGFQTDRLAGGYKAFRNHVLDSFKVPREVHIVSGKTGSGKTEILSRLAAMGEQTIDLEGLASHKGSVFGGLDEPDQPRQQQFENRLALRWRRLDPARPVYLEDESRRIGAINVPAGIWRQMRKAPAYVVQTTVEARVERLVDIYGTVPPGELKDAIRLVEKRLGGLRTKQALRAVDTGNLPEACRHLLHYYDKAYLHGLTMRDAAKVHRLPEESDSRKITDILLERRLQ